MTRTITIDPVTRIEGHARVEIDVDDQKRVVSSIFKVLDFRGWETFLLGTQIEQMPLVTARICGTCSTSHHLAAAKAVDKVFGVEPPPAAIMQRYVMNLAGYIHSHSIHFFVLAAPDLLLDSSTPPATRNLIGLIQSPHTVAIAKMALELRRISTDIGEEIGGRGIHPVTAVAGGMSQVLTETTRERLYKKAQRGLELTKELFNVVTNTLATKSEVLDSLPLPTHYLGITNNGLLDHYQGVLRLTSPIAGNKHIEFTADNWETYLKEQTTTDSYAKSVLFNNNGQLEHYRVGALARINGCDKIDTPLAQSALQQFRKRFGHPCHQTPLYHYTRLIELLYATEKLVELLNNKEICSAQVRIQPTNITKTGIGVVEAPRGVLIHDYKTDADGIVTAINLMVATQQNITSINKTIGMAAQKLIDNANDEALMNGIEMSIRCYDPCLSCATHRLGDMKMHVIVRHNQQIIRTAKRF